MSIHAVTVFLRGHTFTHADEVAPSPPFSVADKIWTAATPSQLRLMPKGLNAVVWHFWHMACAEDEGFSMVAGLPRRLEQGIGLRREQDQGRALVWRLRSGSENKIL